MRLRSRREDTFVASGDRAPSEGTWSYPGWTVVLAAFFGVMFSFAAIVPYTFSLFITPLHAQFGWKREAISGTFGLAAITVAAVSPAIGFFLDRYPPRRIVLPSIVIFACALMSLSRLTPQLNRFYFTYFVLGVVGNGTAQLSYSRSVLTWFRHRRGVALAAMLTGGGVGSIILPLITQSVIGSHGWRAGYLTLGCLALLGFPLSAMFLRNRPDAYSADAKLSEGSIGDVFRTGTFWLIAAMVLLGAFGANGVLSHLAALLSERGVSGAQTALALSCLGGSGIAGRLLTGYLLDRFHAPTLSLIMFLLCAVGITCFAYASSGLMGIAGALLLGFGMGSESDICPFLIARYFGQNRFATLYGVSWTAYAIGGATGPVLTGHLYDKHGAYRPSAILLLAATSVVAAFLNLGLPRHGCEASYEAILTEPVAIE